MHRVLPARHRHLQHLADQDLLVPAGRTVEQQPLHRGQGPLGVTAMRLGLVLPAPAACPHGFTVQNARPFGMGSLTPAIT
jgi:hypothetical protein